jgi:predicted HNH restriction endonuclease
MEKEFLKECVDNGMSINEIGNKVDKAPSTIRYWLTKFGFKTKNKSFKQIGIVNYGSGRCCPRCDETKPTTEFYQRRGKESASVYCKKCTSDQSLERQRGLKQMAINYKGGVCQECGYHKCNGALEFHHIDPKEKDFSISSVKGYGFSEQIKKELDKCVLVCANCHREIHAGILKQ